MHTIFAHYLTLVSLFFTNQDTVFEQLPNFKMEEIVVLKEYTFKNEREKIKYRKLLKDVRRVYPFLQIIKSEYRRINLEMEMYDKEERKEFLKWYEQYAQENYMPILGSFTLSQNHLLLKLIDRELEQTPYELIKTYRNGFRAMLWQGVALFFLANINSEYNPEKNPMLEHIMIKVESEFRGTVPRGLTKPYFDSKSPYNFK
ncbi:MAG: DUF4294 domain-containing protein [Prolixibacteraceae bacterium]|nr:DUF4294 domain-containing protein [Prolixibacteraceae bacterium]